MPVIINEIQITAHVADANMAGRSAQSNAAPTSAPAQMETIVRLCVEEVMRVLKEKEER